MGRVENIQFLLNNFKTNEISVRPVSLILHNLKEVLWRKM